MNVYRLYDGLRHTCVQARTPDEALAIAAQYHITEEGFHGTRKRQLERKRFLSKIRLVELIGRILNP